MLCMEIVEKPCGKATRIGKEKKRCFKSGKRKVCEVARRIDGNIRSRQMGRENLLCLGTWLALDIPC